MKVYKYREAPDGDSVALARLERIVQKGLVWCARPDTLNDPTEFAWCCDFTESSQTVRIVSELLIREKGRPPGIAMRKALEVVRSGKLAGFGQTIVDDTIRQCRDEIGVACFGDTASNTTLWARYAGEGSGVCVEIDVPNDLMGTQLHRVEYNDRRTVHIDDFIVASYDIRVAALHYATLLTKSLNWKPENEVRFLATRQQVEVCIDRSRVTHVYLGPNIGAAASSRVRGIAGHIPVSSIAVTA